MLSIHTYNHYNLEFDPMQKDYDNYYARENNMINDIDAERVFVVNADKIKNRYGIDLNLQSIDAVADAIKAAHPNRTAGQDLTFSASKSVSLLFATADDKIKAKIINDFSSSVKEVLQYINNNELFARTKQNNDTTVVQAHDAAMIAVMHASNRNQDAHLHMHTIIFNDVTVNDKSYAIDTKRSLTGETRLQLDNLFKTILADKLERDLSIKFDKNFEVIGISQDVIKDASSRDREIKEYEQKHNVSHAEAFDATRQAKKDMTLQELSQKAKEKYGNLYDQLDRSYIEKKQADQQIIADIFNVATKVNLSQGQGVFTKTELLATAAKIAHESNVSFDLIKYSNAFDQLTKDYVNSKNKDDIVNLGKANGKDYYTTHRNLANEMYIAKHANNTIDKNIIERAGVSKDQYENIYNQYKENYTKEKGFWLNEKQEELVKSFFTNQQQFMSVQGLAGTGKTTAFGAIADLTKEINKIAKQEINIVGLAPTNKAASELSKAGLKAETVHSFLLKAERQRLDELQQTKQVINNLKNQDYNNAILKSSKKAILQHYNHINNILQLEIGKEKKNIDAVNPKKTIDDITNKESQQSNEKLDYHLKHLQKSDKINVIIKDEASMSDNIITRALAEYAVRTQAQLVAVGDQRQLESVGAGRSFYLMQKSSSFETKLLDAINRQKDPEMRNAIRELATAKNDNDYSNAMQNIMQHIADKHDLVETKDKSKIVDAAIEKYAEKSSQFINTKNVAIITNTNELVHEINAKIQNKLIESNRLDKDDFIELKDAILKDAKKITSNDITYELQQEKKADIKLHKDDRVIFLAKDKEIKVVKGETGTIEYINKDQNMITVKKDDNVVVNVDLNKYKNIALGYATTVHKSQGMTKDHVIYAADADSQTHNQHHYYVAVSRQRDSVSIVTQDVEQLIKNVVSRNDKATAIDIYNANHTADKDITQKTQTQERNTNAERTQTQEREIQTQKEIIQMSK